MVSPSVTVVYVDTSYLRLLGSRYQLIVAPVKVMSALAAAAAPVVVVAVVANSISGVDSNIYIVMITMTGPCRGSVQYCAVLYSINMVVA